MYLCIIYVEMFQALVDHFAQILLGLPILSQSFQIMAYGWSNLLHTRRQPVHNIILQQGREHEQQLALDRIVGVFGEQAIQNGR